MFAPPESDVGVHHTIALRTPTLPLTYNVKSDDNIDKGNTEDVPKVPEPVPEPKDKGNDKEKNKDDDKESDKDKKKDEEKDDQHDDIEKKIDEITGHQSLRPVAAGAAGGSAPPSKGDSDDKSEFPPMPTAGIYPRVLAIPMTNKMPMPGSYFSLNVTDPQVIDAIHEILSHREPYFGLFLVKNAPAKDTDVIREKDFVNDMGVYCQLSNYSKMGSKLTATAYVHARCKMEKLITPQERPQVATEQKVNEDKKEEDNVKAVQAVQNDDNVASEVEKSQDVSEELPLESSFLDKFEVSTVIPRIVKDNAYDKNDPTIRAHIGTLKDLMATGAMSNPAAKGTMAKCTALIGNPSMFADALAATLPMNPEALQMLVSTLDVAQRLEIVVELLSAEIRLLEVRQMALANTAKKLRGQLLKTLVKDHVLEMSKLTGILDDKKKPHKFEKRLAKLKMTKEAKEAYKTEFEKLTNGNDHPTELVVVEKYLDWLTLIPWGIFSKDKFNLAEARKILDRDHYGLKDVKERILEFISIGKVSGKVDGKILCLTGPPGTGKTSIAKSIAEALGRRYVRISMGGIRDIHEVKGHRRTYVGSIPGRIILSLKQARTSNPLMLIDEIDKLDMSASGGAALAFLEILDPEQNHGFLDNYMDVKVDLSKVLFVCTANYLGNIPPPLRDRMEVIHVSGYTNNEKIEIIEKHLIPNAVKKVGLSSKHVELTRNAISRLVEKYCRESGLRNLKTLITRIFSKAAFRIVEEMDKRAPPVVESKIEGKDLVEAKEVDINAKEESSSAAEELKEMEEDEEAEEDEYDEKVLGVELVKDGEELVKLDVADDIKYVIDGDNLKDYVGPEIYTRDRLYESLPPGVATGLSYSSSGNGDALYIESILTNSISSGSGHAGVKITGSLKDVMKESAAIAYSFVKLYMVNKYPENRFFEAAEVHVHCPDGSIPKDGPSAGVSFSSSLLSLALNEPIPSNIAMTGEITVTGRVLPVGGLREKILGAKRYGCDTVIFPKDIENELEEIPDEVKEGVTFIRVEWYQEVFDAIFPHMTAEKGNSIWKDEFAKLDQKEKKTKKRADKDKEADKVKVAKA